MKLRKMRPIWMLVLPMALFFAESCEKDVDNLRNGWQPSFAAPLVDADLSILNLLTTQDSAYLKVNPTDKSLSFVYQTDLPTQSAESLLPPSPDYHGRSGYHMSNAIALHFKDPLDPGVDDSVKTDIPLEIGDPSTNPLIDTLGLKSGALELTLFSDFKDSVMVDLFMPCLVDAKGVGYKKTFNLSYFPGAPSRISITELLSLNGYVLDLTKGGTTHNTAAAQIKVRIKNTGVTETIDNTDSVGFQVAFKGIQFGYLVGDLGKVPFPPLPTDSITIPAFKFNKGGNTVIKLDKTASIKVNVTNSFGIPIDVKLDKFDAKYADGHKSNIDTVRLVIKSQASLHGKPATSVDSLDVNKLLTALQQQPVAVYYGGSVKIANAGTQSNFVADTSKIRASIITKIPLKLSIKDFVLLDTLAVSAPSSDQMNKVENMNLRLITQNEFPFDVTLQVYFLDNNNKQLGSPLMPVDKQILTAYSGTGPVAQHIIDISMDHAQVLAIQGFSKVIIKATLNTYTDPSTKQQPTVQLYANSKLKVKMGIQAKVTPVKK